MVASVGIFPSPAQAISRAAVARKVVRLQAELNAVADRISDAESDLEFANASIAKHLAAVRTASAQIAILRSSRSRRSAQLYIFGDATFDVLSSSGSVDIFADRLSYLEELRSTEQTSLENLIALKRHAKAEAQELEASRSQAQKAYAVLARARRSLQSKLTEYKALLGLIDFSSGGSRSPRGFHCPVAGPHGLANNFGAPRPGGPHQGDDMPADTGTPVVAVLGSHVSDVVFGGWMGRGIIIRDAAGNEYYYAHLSAEYVNSGESLDGGEVIGRVGCSGNCTGPHLHFEYHPNGGSARNPYHLLSAVC